VDAGAGVEEVVGYAGRPACGPRADAAPVGAPVVARADPA